MNAVVTRDPRIQAFLAGIVYAAGPRRALEILASLTEAELARLADTA